MWSVTDSDLAELEPSIFMDFVDQQATGNTEPRPSHIASDSSSTMGNDPSVDGEVQQEWLLLRYRLGQLSFMEFKNQLNSSFAC